MPCEELKTAKECWQRFKLGSFTSFHHAEDEPITGTQTHSHSEPAQHVLIKKKELTAKIKPETSSTN